MLGNYVRINNGKWSSQLVRLIHFLILINWLNCGFTLIKTPFIAKKFTQIDKLFTMLPLIIDAAKYSQ